MYAADGGYGEGSGAATLMELWTALAPFVDRYNQSKSADQPFIVPFVIQIDNSYDEPAGPDVRTAVPQFLVPPNTVMVARGTESERTRQALQLGFNKPFPLATGVAYCDSRYAHFDLRAHPGPGATVGWTLSSVAFDDLVHQLRIPATDYDPLKQVTSWWQPQLGNCALT
jgi:hypothetical protein